MADIVNLRRARKTKERAAAEVAAQANRAKFGRTKAEKMASRADKDHASKVLNAHRLDRKDKET